MTSKEGSGLYPLGARSQGKLLSRTALVVAMLLGVVSHSFVFAQGTPESAPTEAALPEVIPPAPADPAPPVADPAPTDPIVEETDDQVPAGGDDANAGDDPTDVPATTVPTSDVNDDEASTPAIPDVPEAATEVADVAPAISFNPALLCNESGSRAPPVAGDMEWTYLDCKATWETSNVSTVSLQPTDPSVEWEIVAINDRKLQNPNTMILDPQPLTLTNANPAGAEFTTSEFELAMRVSCVDPTTITIPLTFKATSGENALEETATVKHQLNAKAATLPDVALTSAVFENASPTEGSAISTGVITMNYSNGSANCGWQITTTVADFVAPEGVLLASDLSLVEVSGPAGLICSINGGVITVIAPSGTAMPTSGTLSITVSMPVPETVSSGVYATSITADAGAP